jgi:dUTP pyrophosphatase
MPNLKYYKVHPNAISPAFATQQSACFDLSFCSEGKYEYSGYNHYNKKFTRPYKDGNIFIGPQDRIMVPTGLILDIPERYSVRVHARSGLSLKQGLVLANSEGIIDSDYIEELFVLVFNRSDNGWFINNGDRIAQGELIKTETYKLAESKKAPEQKTDRKGGMGSTGVNDAKGA